MTSHIYTYIDPPSKKHMSICKKILENDGVICYPTDSNWAFACDINSKKAINRILQLKPRHPEKQPFSILCSSLSMISEIASLDNFAYRVIKKILPGPYTILLKRNISLPKQIKDKRRIVGIKMPDNKLPLALVDFYDFPLLTSSVPIINKNGNDIITKFGIDINKNFPRAVDLILDLGDEMIGTDSTILDLSTGELKLIREGHGPVNDLF